MIKSVEIKNFENHEHTVFTDFSPNFNLICGPSDCGKTAVIRAIKTVSFNEFNAGSVRIGAKYCEITITTERGIVTARRGKNINEWDVTPIGKETVYYKSAGKGILEDVAEIIGLKVIQLGDIKIKVNVMDQLESHFMMSEIEGKEASGSLRAQIIDEISGLSGIEPLIKEIGTDHLRLKKEVTALEEENSELIDKLHKEEELQKEEEVLSQAEALLKKNVDLKTKIRDMNLLTNLNSETLKTKDFLVEQLKKLQTEEELNEVQKLLECIDDSKIKLSDLNKYQIEYSNSAIKLKTLIETSQLLPDVKELQTLINIVDGNLVDINHCINYVDRLEKLEREIMTKVNDLGTLPDVVEVENLYDSASESLFKEKQFIQILNEGRVVYSSLKKQQEELKKIPNVGLLDEVCFKLEETILKLKELLKYYHEFDMIDTTLKASQQQIVKIEQEFHECERENSDILSEFDVCPFCNQNMEKM